MTLIGLAILIGLNLRPSTTQTPQTGWHKETTEQLQNLEQETKRMADALETIAEVHQALKDMELRRSEDPDLNDGEFPEFDRRLEDAIEATKGGS